MFKQKTAESWKEIDIKALDKITDIDNAIDFMHENTVPVAEYQALEAQLAAGQEKNKKLEQWCYDISVRMTVDDKKKLNQILHPEK